MTGAGSGSDKQKNNAAFNGIQDKFRNKFYPLSAHFYTIEKTNREKDHLTSPHFHDYPQLLYCFDGSYTHTVGDTEYRCGAGDLIIVPPGISHSYTVKRGDIRSFVQINILLNFFDGFESDSAITAAANMFLHCFSPELKAEIPILFRFTGEEKERADRIMLKLSKHDYEKHINSYRSLKAIFLDFFSLPPFSLSEKTLARARKLIDEKYIPVLRTAYYMNLNFSQKITVDELVELSKLCRTHYFRFFKKAFGVTYSTYLQLVRVSHAEMLCKFSRYSFSYIADMCGFGNQAYMNDRIKKLGTVWRTPGEMRRDRSDQLSKWPSMLMTRDDYEKLSVHFHAFGL